MADPVVLDASVWLAVLLQEEGSDLLKAHLTERRLSAPEFVRLETANGLLVATRRRRVAIKKVTMRNLLEGIRDFPIDIVPAEMWWEEACHLVLRHDLAFYDAAYAACARELKIPLITLDQKLLHICLVEKIDVIES